MRDVITFILGSLCIFCFLMLLGAVGDVECGTATLEDGLGKMVLWLVCFGGSVLLTKLVGGKEHGSRDMA